MTAPFSTLTDAGAFNVRGGTLNLTGSTTGAVNALGSTLDLTGITFGGTGNFTNLGTLNVSGTTNFGSGTFALDGGVLTIAAAGTLNKNGGAFNVAGGTLAGGGTLGLAGGATFDITGSGTRVLDGQTLNLSNFTLGGGSLEFRSGTLNLSGPFVIAPGASMIVTSVAGFTAGGGIENDGSFTLQDTAPYTLIASGTHSGSFVAGPGATLTLGGASQTFASGASFGGAGTVNIGPTTASYSGTVTVNGANVFLSAGTHSFTTGNLVINGTLTAAAGLNWDGTGSIGGTGTLVIPAGQTLALNNSGNRSVDTATIANAGTIRLNMPGASQMLFLQNGAVIDNTAATSVIEFTPAGGNSQLIDTTLGIGTIGNTNGGTIRNSGAGAATVDNSVLNNSGGILETAGVGPLNVQSGSANFSGTLTVVGANVVFDVGVFNYGGTLTGTGGAPLTILGGTHNFGDGAVLDFPGGIAITGSPALNFTGTTTGATLAAGTTLDLTGRTLGGSGVLDNLGTLDLTGATVGGSITQGAGAVTTLAGTTIQGTYAQNGGTVTASGNSFVNGAGVAYTLSGGTLTLQPGGNLTAAQVNISGGTLLGTGTLTGAVNNSGGTLRPGASPGVLTIDGDYTQGPAGLIAFELGGLAAGTGYDRLVVTGVATLDGAMDVVLINAFVPATGNTFDVVQAGNVVGAFASESLPAGMTTAYAPTKVATAIGGAPPPPPVAETFTQPLLQEFQPYRGTASGAGAGDPFQPQGAAGAEAQPVFLGYEPQTGAPIYAYEGPVERRTSDVLMEECL